MRWIGCLGLMALMAIAGWPRGVSAQGGKVMRVIQDAATGECWILERNAEHPAGSGRLARMDSDYQKSLPALQNGVAAKVVIHAGDPVVVEEKSAMVEARLEGVALGSASKDGTLAVRLKLGGRVIRATALAPGRARLAVEVGR